MFKKIKKFLQIQNLTPSVFDSITKGKEDEIVQLGDGGAVFFGEGTTEEFEQQQKEDDGTAPWYQRLKNL